MYSKSLKIIYTISLLDLFAVGLTVPLLNSYLLSLGASRTTIGFAQSTYSLLQIFWGPIFGSFSDVFGRKFIFFLILLSCSICYFLLGLCTSISVFFLIRIVLGLVKHTQTLCKAVIADVVSDKKQTEALGFTNGLSSLGFILGPLIGGYLIEYRQGFFLVCLLTSLVFLCDLVLVLQLPADSKPKKTECKPVKLELLGSFKNIKGISWREYWDGFLLRLLFALSTSVYFFNQSLYVQDKYELSQRHVGMTISFFGSISLVSSLLMGYLSEKYYRKDNYCYKRLLHAYFLMTVSLLGIYWSKDIYIFYFLLFPYSMASTALRIVSMELLLSRSSKNNLKGCLAGASNSVMSFARLLTPVTSGFVADFFGEEANILFAAMPALFGTLIALTLHKRYNKMRIE